MSCDSEDVNRRLLRARDAMDRAYSEPLDVCAIAAVAHNGDNGGGSAATNGFTVLAPDSRAIAATKTLTVAGSVSTTISWTTRRAGSWIVATFRAA